MKKLLKVLLYLLGTLIALVIVAAVAVKLFVDPNDYKDEIQQLVKDKTGRDLRLEGDISLSLFPWIGVETGPAELANAQGFGPEPFARMEHAGIKVKLWPLVHKEVVVDTIILQGANVHLARNAKGVTNWQDLVPEGQSESESAGGGIAGLVISGVQLRDSTISWDDASTDTHYTASGIDLTTSQVSLDQPFDVDLSLDLKSANTGLDARVTMHARPTVNLKSMSARLDDFQFALNGRKGQGDAAMPLAIRANADAAADLAAGTAELRDLELQAWNVKARGGARVNHLTTAPRYTATLKVAEFSPRKLIEQLTGSDPETSDASVLAKAAADLDVEGDANALDATLSNAYLDDTKINGQLGIKPLAAMAMRLKLNVGAINLDRYMAPASEQASSDAPLASPGEAVAAGGSLIPVETLRGLNLNGNIHADALTVAGLKASDIDVTIKAADGQVRVHPLDANFYQGRYSGDISVDARGDKPMLTMNEKLEGVQAGPLLADAAGKSWMTGLGNLSLQSTADLSSPEAARRSLSGKFAFDFSDGAIFGINIVQRIRQAVALFQGQSMSLEAGEQKTDFSSFVVDAAMDNGVIEAKTMKLVSPVLQITGGGKVNLGDYSVDMSFTPKLTGKLGDAAGDTLKRLTGQPIPLKFSGSLLSPKINLDIAAALKGQVKERVGQELMNKLGGKQGGESGAPDNQEQLKQRALDALMGSKKSEQPAPQQESGATEETAQEEKTLTPEERKAQRQAERRKERQEAREKEKEEGGGG